MDKSGTNTSKILDTSGNMVMQPVPMMYVDPNNTSAMMNTSGMAGGQVMMVAPMAADGTGP